MRITAATSVWRRVTGSPLDTFIGLISLVAGVGYELGAPAPGSVDAVLPSIFLHVWGLLLLFGGAGVIAGIAVGWRRIFNAGLWLLAGGIGVYSIALIHLAGHRGDLQAATNIALAIFLLISAHRVRGPEWTRR